MNTAPGLYADRLPTRELTLAELIDAAELASKRNDYCGTEAEIDRKENAMLETREAVRAYLADNLGLTKDQIDALGGVL